MRTLAAFLLVLWSWSCAPASTTRCERDENCPAGQACIQGTCQVSSCPDQPCGADERCLQGRCYAEDCATRLCPGLGEVCLAEDCLPDSCLEVICPEDQGCAHGHCYPVDCQTRLCRGYGEVCVQEECRQRSCVGVSCPLGLACANGHCYPTECASLQCPADRACVDGECVESSCAEVTCPVGERCANSRCWPEDCPGQDCEAGQVCEQDVCLEARCVEQRCECQVDADCAAGEACLAEWCCQVSEADEASCDDDRDNDCDGAVDCADGDCTGKTCDDGDPGTPFSTCDGSGCVAGTPECTPVGATEPCGRCSSGTRTCQAGNVFGPCLGEQGCVPDSTQVCDTCDGTHCLPCGTQTCDPLICAFGPCEGPDPRYRCSQCGTGECRDYLTHEDSPNCGCLDSVAAPNCDTSVTYELYCDYADWYCDYERREVTEDCNCRWECP